jgi:hypothetical protein
VPETGDLKGLCVVASVFATLVLLAIIDWILIADAIEHGGAFDFPARDLLISLNVIGGIPLGFVLYLVFCRLANRRRGQ